MSNFNFIPSLWSHLSETAREAEQQVYSAPMFCAILCRKSLEEWVRWMYERDSDLHLPYDTTLNSLIHEQRFKELVAPNQFNQINLVRKLGNNAVHTNARIQAPQVLHALKLLHGFIGWLTQIYSEEKITVPPFDVSLVPDQPGKDKTKEELKKLETAYLQQQQALKKAQDELETYKANKERNLAFVPYPTDPNEEETRRAYINVLLEEAGWNPNGENVAEYQVKNCMPQANGSKGTGFVDYVLWGNDGKPVAVVEAKRTKRDPRVGQHQAKCYADCLEAEFGQRPVIFYSNGFNTWLWDDTNYAPREVFGFYTKDELELLIQRRSFMKSLANQTINSQITDRPYQHEAIRSVANALEDKKREALLVMATGTGKTRVAASIIDFLSKAGWVKRVLFLADRNALVHQAKNNLNDYLPNLPAVDLTKEKEDESSRIVFSTYQTIINMIDGEADGNNRFYSVGHFDLIIFDEIHRSVYNRYRHIFRYFDGIRLGLTATPKQETHRDTYALFEMETGNPTFAYELNAAVADQFLVPYKGISVPVKFQRQGIKYNELSDAEKLQYEEQFTDPETGAYPSEIDAEALNSWLFNTDTVDKIIGHFMQHGIKVEAGDKLAKTMVFARSHKHAKYIEARFNLQYPNYSGHFLSVIDYQEEYKYDLLNKFKDPAKYPQIAVSVDMLDTGIDVPEVCNLVFFKPIKSSTKFWQMIGRGTRLCENLFAPGVHKKEFLIFDYCQNFEYFDLHPTGVEGTNAKSISQRLFELRLRLGFLLLKQPETELKGYGKQLIDHLIGQTQALNEQNFIVRMHWEQVKKYKDPNAWNALSDLDLKELNDHIAPIITEIDQDEKAKSFDALMMNMQLCVLNSERKLPNLIQNVVQKAEKLSKKASIPAINYKMETILAVQEPVFWRNISILQAEKVRIELRDLLKFLDHEASPVYYTSFEDELETTASDYHVPYQITDLKAYKRKTEQYLQEHRTHLPIYKLRNNIPITKHELAELEKMLFEQGSLGTKTQFINAYGEQPLGKFIRSILGMESNAAKLAFGELLQNQTLNAAQIRFIDILINFLTQKGIVEPANLFEAPFTDLHSGGIAGVFDPQTTNRIIYLIEQINKNAEVA